MDEFTEWLLAHHSDVYEAAIKYIADKPTWDLMDGCDAVDSEVYNYYCEYIIK